MEEFFQTIGVLLVIVVVIVGCPLALIWAGNTLFSFGIEYTWQTWLATLTLWAFTCWHYSSSKDK